MFKFVSGLRSLKSPYFHLALPIQVHRTQLQIQMSQVSFIVQLVHTLHDLFIKSLHFFLIRQFFWLVNFLLESKVFQSAMRAVFIDDIAVSIEELVNMPLIVTQNQRF
jgi:hypothetical protein